MYFIIYETTNLINGMKYRGLHKCKSLDDGYLGSGKRFISALKKYGKENFKRKILEFCKSQEDMIEREAFYVNNEWVKSKNNYNVALGGTGQFSHSKETKELLSKMQKGIKKGPQSEKHRMNQSIAKKNLLNDNEKAPAFILKCKEAASKRTPEHYEKCARSRKFNTHVKNALEWERKMGWTK